MSERTTKHQQVVSSLKKTSAVLPDLPRDLSDCKRAAVKFLLLMCLLISLASPLEVFYVSGTSEGGIEKRCSVLKVWETDPNVSVCHFIMNHCHHD